jgi:hypothetical protein
MTMGHQTFGEEADGAFRRPFIANDGGLKVYLPSDPTERNATLRTGVGPVEVHGFYAEHNGIVYLAAYSECHARLSLLEYVKVLDAPLDQWVPDAERRKPLGERLLAAEGSMGPREEDFALPSRKGGEKLIARRRWMERQGFFYQAIVVMPEARAASAEVAEFLGSLEVAPIAVDRRGLTPAWKRHKSKDEGFTALWPERFDDAMIRVVKTPTWSASYSTYFVFQRSMGFAVTTIRHYPPTLLAPGVLRIGAAEALDSVRDRFLCDYHAELLRERPILLGELVGREFEARFAGATNKEHESRRHPPGPGVGRVKARLYVSLPRVFLVFVTTPNGQDTHKGVESFLNSFRLVEP